MALHDIIGDRIAVTCSSAPGTGSSFSLDASAPAGYATIAQSLANGVVSPDFVFPYYIAINGNAGAPAIGTVFEITQGQYTPGSPNTLARAATPFRSSNSGNKVNFTSSHLPIVIFPFASADILNSLLQGHIGAAAPSWLRRGPWWGLGGGTTSRELNFLVVPGTNRRLFKWDEAQDGIDVEDGLRVAGVRQKLTRIVTLGGAQANIVSNAWPSWANFVRIRFDLIPVTNTVGLRAVLQTGAGVDYTSSTYNGVIVAGVGSGVTATPTPSGAAIGFGGGIHNDAAFGGCSGVIEVSGLQDSRSRRVDFTNTYFDGSNQVHVAGGFTVGTAAPTTGIKLSFTSGNVAAASRMVVELAP